VESIYSPFAILNDPQITGWPKGLQTKFVRFEGDKSTLQEQALILFDGFFAIDTNTLIESNSSVYLAEGEFITLDNRPFSRLRSISPINWIGTTICVFSSDQIRWAVGEAAESRDEP